MVARAINNKQHSWYIIGVDRWMLFSVVCLLLVGAVMVASSSIAIAEKYNHDSLYYFKRHLLFIGLGVFISLIVMNVSNYWTERLSRPFMFVGLILLSLVLIPGFGVEVNGAQRWLNLGVSRFQVVELVKLTLILYLAGYVVRHKLSLQNSMFGVLKPLMLVILVAFLLLLQPDFGSAVLLMIVTLFMVFIAGARYRDLFIISMLTMSALAYLAWAEPYRVARLANFIDPWDDPFDAGFQLVQALIAVGRGEFGGVGIGASIQKLFYLPEAHTDFIFAVYAEEMGFVGVVFMVAIFVLLFARIFVVAKRAFDRGQDFAGYMCTGIVVWLALQTFFSMGVNLGLLPTKGLTLPFISSGGSAIMMNVVAIALVFRVSYENRKSEISIVKKEVEQ